MYSLPRSVVAATAECLAAWRRMLIFFHSLQMVDAALLVLLLYLFHGEPGNARRLTKIIPDRSYLAAAKSSKHERPHLFTKPLPA